MDLSTLNPLSLFFYVFSGSSTAEFLAVFMNSAFRQNPAFWGFFFFFCSAASAEQKPVGSLANKTAAARWTLRGIRAPTGTQTGL